MNPILLSPKIESDKSIPEQLQQMKSYLFQFKEQMELLLTNIDSDNVSEKFKDDFSKIVGSRIMNGKEMSEILQTAGMIKMSVKDVSNSVSSLALTVDGIYAEVHGANGILARLDIDESGISASVKKGTNYSGVAISSSGIKITSTGSVTINGDIIVNGTLKVSSLVRNEQGSLELGDIFVNDILTLGSTSIAHFYQTYASYLDVTHDVSVGGQISCDSLSINGDYVRTYQVKDVNGNTVTVYGNNSVG